ncbi:TadE/TadG family type IV pilus assembly protein [Propioniciclava soli]|uniref:TadE/TadG family type IV pilus assembly protein n=1 Tax=Propioniciclava soli TaxID=2775081 RepID=UPI001E3DCE76|nr:TadE family protein [Propioniciclava soli]
MTHPQRETRRGERGAASVEFVVIVPALLLIISLVLAGGRLALARSAVQQMADSAARSASLARDASTARQHALEVIGADAAAAGLRCSGGLDHVIGTSGFFVSVGQEARVEVQVRCAVTLGDLLVAGLPGTWVIEGQASSAIDRYRGRR